MIGAFAWHSTHGAEPAADEPCRALVAVPFDRDARRQHLRTHQPRLEGERVRVRVRSRRRGTFVPLVQQHP